MTDLTEPIDWDVVHSDLLAEFTQVVDDHPDASFLEIIQCIAEITPDDKLRASFAVALIAFAENEMRSVSERFQGSRAAQQQRAADEVRRLIGVSAVTDEAETGA